MIISLEELTKAQSFEIAGFNVGLAKARVPDDYFVLSQSYLNQYYNLQNTSLGFLLLEMENRIILL
ncbi:MAG: hypothetical protein CM15mP102_01300 [Flavobacteriales bacterium]|nr:MAG: hypothetical protein CM15mP102_01300 [Flavobacteriales bacterium]